MGWVALHVWTYARFTFWGNAHVAAPAQPTGVGARLAAWVIARLQDGGVLALLGSALLGSRGCAWAWTLGALLVVALALSLGGQGAHALAQAIHMLVLMPLGLEGPALTAVGWGIEAVLGIAAEVARWPGAVTLVPAAPDASLGLVVFGGLWLCLWSKRWRLLGLLPMAVAVTLAVAARPPDILVDRDAGMVGVRGATGMAISHGRAKSYAGEMWLRRSGLANAEPWPRSGMLCDSHGCREISPEGLVISLAWKAEAMAEDCQTADVMISFVPVRGACRRASVVIDRFDLWRNGAHALWLEKGDTRVVSSRSVRGDRPWVPYRSTRKAQ